MFKRPFACLLTLALLLTACGSAQAQKLSVNIVNGTKSSIPVVVVPFANQGSGLPPSTDISAVVTMDLARSGKFRTLDKNDIVESPTSGDQIKFPTWKLLKQDYIVVGRLKTASGGASAVQVELWNVNSQKKMLDLSYTAQPGNLRGVAHQIADRIYQEITGVRGAFDTRIAYITAVGEGKHIVYSLIVADSDGYNPQVVVRSRETLMSPAWSPDGTKLAYVSFESGDSNIYIQDLSTGSRKLVSAHKGINSSPAFSPDGTKLLMSLSYVGNPEIFVMDLASGKERRLTHNFSIDTEPRFTPDGSSIVFTSDRSGKPQLYSMPADGGTPQRLTFQGAYNAAPSLGPDGKKIAMVRGSGNVYRIAVMDQSLGGQTHFVSPGNLDDAPSFAPNGSMLLYAASQGLRGVLYSVSEDGKVRQRLMLSHGDVRQPAWGPYRSK